MTFVIASRLRAILSLGIVLSFLFIGATAFASEPTAQPDVGATVRELYNSTGIHGFIHGEPVEPGHEAHGLLPGGLGQFIMIAVGCLLIYLAIAKGFEPLLLLPIGFGGILANIPLAGIAAEGGMLRTVYEFGIVPPGLFPLLIFMGVGAM